MWAISCLVEMDASSRDKPVTQKRKSLPGGVPSRDFAGYLSFAAISRW